MSFETDLRAHLHDKADSVQVPERTLEITPHPTRSSRGRLWNALSATAIVAVAIGGLGYFVNVAGNSSDAPAVQATFPEEAAITPSIRGLDPLVGDLEFVWQETSDLDVSAVVPLGDGFLVFDRAGGQDGAHCQRTIAGDEWVDLGHPVEGGFPEQLAPWRDGIAGIFIDVRTGNPALWSSLDGANWERGTLPPTSPTATQVRILGQIDGGLLIHAGYDDSDGLAEAIRHSLEGTYPPKDFFIEVTAATVRVVHQTLFVEVASFDRAELGLQPRLESSEPADLGYWWSDDLIAWRPIPPDQIADGFEPIEVFETDTQSFLVGRSSPKLYVSQDGFDWDPQPLSSSYLLAERDGEFIVAGYAAESDSLFLHSTNLRRWEPMPAPQAFDDEPNLTTVAAGPVGLAGVVIAEPDPGQGGSDTGFRFEIETDSSIVVYDLIQGTIEVTRDSETVWSSSIFAIDPNHAEYDPDADSVTYLDPDTGAPVATVTADEVAAGLRPDPGRAALLFTDDYESWVVDFLPRSDRGYDVTVGNHHVAVVMDGEIWIGRPE